MFLEPTLLSLVIAKLRGGSLKTLETVHIRAWYLLLASAGLQFLVSLLQQSNSFLSQMIIRDYFFYLHMLSYLLLIVTITLNIRKASMKFFLLGLMLNFIVIFSNNGKMPVAIDGIKGRNNTQIQIKVSDIKHKAMSDRTKMPYLADIIRIPPPYPLPKIISMGDVFLICGVFVFFQETIVKAKPSNLMESS